MIWMNVIVTVLPGGQLLPDTVMSREVRMWTVVGVTVIDGFGLGLGTGEGLGVSLGLVLGVEVG